MENSTETKNNAPVEAPPATKTVDAIAARAAELRKYEGKTFAPNKGDHKPVKIVSYGGVKSHIEMRDQKPVQVHSHTFVMDNGWTPPATKFLSEWHEIKPETTTQQIPE
ncbi:MAG: hypothetical protein KGL39_47515 [Patescibacteria group bacterium]|nr:hypothetical protein [Patescibacteria group bacterium]